jgi:hypothetical protein
VNIWNLVLEHRFREALVAYDAKVKTSEAVSYLDVANRATVHLCLNELAESLAGFQRANKLAAEGVAEDHSAYLESIGALQWLLGQRHEALQTFRAAVDGILSGSIDYADNAGGASPGLRLFYAAITSKDEAEIAFSVGYLTDLSKKPRIAYWPGPLALLVLEMKSFSELLAEHFGASDERQATEMAQQDLLKRRELVQSLFYVATMERKHDRERECNSWMVKCANLKNPVLELEWYLARAESMQARRNMLSSF